MHSSSLKRAPVLDKFKFLAARMRQIFKFGKAKKAPQHKQSSSANNNNSNYEFENNNNNNNEISKLSALLTSEMAQNAANEWLLEQAVFSINTPHTTEDVETRVICLQTDAGHFYWHSSTTLEAQAQSELQQRIEIDCN